MNMVDSTDTVAAEVSINADGYRTRELNALLLAYVRAGARRLRVEGLTGQRYLGTNLSGFDHPLRLELYGTPGNDLGAFLDGPEIEVMGNAQDGVGNTMNRGRIIVHGHAGDILAMSARGGEIFVRGNIGYRGCLHMKEYEGHGPLVVIGGTAQDFFGEYMAGGTAVLLGLDHYPNPARAGHHFRGDAGDGKSRGGVVLVHRILYLATGMHGGRIYIRGEFDRRGLAPQVEVVSVGDLSTEPILKQAIQQFATIFEGSLTDRDRELLAGGPYYRLQPRGTRPYGKMYA